MEILRTQNPFDLFHDWLKAATATEPNDPEAVALATATRDGRVSVRMVLCKQADRAGFCFYTNTESRKGQELKDNPFAAMCFHWKSLQRQVRIEGRVEPLPAAMADAYFSTRHPLSRLGAWASAQSRPLESRAALEENVRKYAAQFGDNVPRPAYWGGYRLIPETIEFWQQGDARLHDRFLFTRDGESWTLTRLNP